MPKHLPSLILMLYVAAPVLAASEPPPEVDAALRSRVSDFYQLQLDRKFRQAEQIVAEDTKDYYYELRKPDLRNFKILDIQYSTDLHTAKVKISSRMHIVTPGAPPMDVDLPIVGDWKLENGKWCWTVDQSGLLETPFGRMNPNAAGTSANLQQVAARMAGAASVVGLQANPVTLNLDILNASPQVVTLKNALPGPVTIQIVTASPILKIEIAKPNLGPDEATTMTVTPVAGSADRPAELVLTVAPLGQTIRIALSYTN